MKIKVIIFSAREGDAILKKKLNSVLALVLSLGIICGSFVCASVEDYKCPLRLMKENVCELRKDIVTHREEII